MAPKDDSADWLADLSWQGYPRLSPVRDVSTRPGTPEESRARRAGDARLESLARENEALRAKIESLTALGAEFERRLSEAASAYENAALETDSARRAAELEAARVTGELASAREELKRRETRELARENDLSLERERRADAERALIEARRRINDLEAQIGDARAKAGETAGALGELRRQADASHDRLVQAKALTDQDVQILRAELREFIAKFRSIQDTLGRSESP